MYFICSNNQQLCTLAAAILGLEAKNCCCAKDPLEQGMQKSHLRVALVFPNSQTCPPEYLGNKHLINPNLYASSQSNSSRLACSTVAQFYIATLPHCCTGHDNKQSAS